MNGVETERSETNSATAAWASTGPHNATTYARLGSTLAASRTNISARDVTATLIWATTCCIARPWDARSRRRAARTPLTMNHATMAAERRNPAVTARPPLASKESTTPEGTSAKSTSVPVKRPTQRCHAGRRWRNRVISRRQSGSDSKADATCTLRDASQSDSNRSPCCSFSMTKGGRSSEPKYARLDAVMRAEPTSINSRNERRGRLAKKAAMPFERTGDENDLLCATLSSVGVTP